jgi:hypothetical protein
VPSITGVRLSPHVSDATLLNISAGGVLIECASRVRLGACVTVIFEGTFSPASVEGRVARSCVANMGKNGILRYHVGIEFTNCIAIAEAPSAPKPHLVTPPPSQDTIPVPVFVNRW